MEQDTLTVKYLAFFSADFLSFLSLELLNIYLIYSFYFIHSFHLKRAIFYVTWCAATLMPVRNASAGRGLGEK